MQREHANGYTPTGRTSLPKGSHKSFYARLPLKDDSFFTTRTLRRVTQFPERPAFSRKLSEAASHPEAMDAEMGIPLSRFADRLANTVYSL